MDLAQSFRILRKRVMLTITVFLLTLAATAGAAVALPWSYKSVGDTVLLNSRAGQASYGNPYLSFDSGLQLTANLLCLQVTDATTKQTLQAQGHTGSYTAAVQSQTGAPLVEITVTAKSPGAAQDTLHAVMGQLNTALAKLQANVTPKNRILTQVLTMTPQASKQTSAKAKPLVVVLALGLILTFVTPQLVERRSARKRSRAVTVTAAGNATLTPSESNGRMPEEAGKPGYGNAQPVTPASRRVQTPRESAEPASTSWGADPGPQYAAHRNGFTEK